MNRLNKASAIFLAILSILTIHTSLALAIVDPLTTANNKFGIHILNRQDIEPARQLVNSNGGDWGYVTLVIREDDRDVQRWQEFFDELREARLIPIVRIATQNRGKHWVKPRHEDIDPWVRFLDSLNWVTKNRYVVIFNEPNHTQEWGGEINPNEYAQIYRSFYKQLKEANPNFFVLPAGLDTAPVNTSTTMHPQEFLEKIYEEDERLFELYDGWVSHSYPNPNFTSSVYNTGRTSVQNYIWEMDIVREFGYDTSKPIFITEAGWATRQGTRVNSNFLSLEQAARNTVTAFEQIWTDERIVAITPFILDYDQPPFDQFAWLDPVTKQPNAVYLAIQDLDKTPGRPIQEESAQALHNYFPSSLLTGSRYMVAIQLQNTGQSIWDEKYQLWFKAPDMSQLRITSQEIPRTLPGETARIWITMETQALPETIPLQISLVNEDSDLLFKTEYEIRILSQSNLVNRFRLWLEDLIRADFSRR